MKRLMILIIVSFTLSPFSHAQDVLQVVKGVVTDRESGHPLPGATVTISSVNPPAGVTADSTGYFRIMCPAGRHTLRISFVGYHDLVLNDILVTSGREVSVRAELAEKVVATEEVVVRSAGGSMSNISQMASVSTKTVRTEDALRYAGGYYDPSRIVNAFAGVIVSNSDDSNDLIIRGNSPRGLLWRLEGIEIPNPNHFSSGAGGSGGAFSSVTSNVIDNFDFFTGAFPAEYGNAFSGVMDLNLRKGNNENHEHAFQTGMIGAELASEGPLTGSSGGSYLVNVRYTNFGLLSNLGLIDLGETNYAPRTADVVFNISYPFKRAGTLSFFGLGAGSALGKTALRDKSKWLDNEDRYEELEKQESLNLGLKHYFLHPGGNTYFKTAVAFTGYSDKYHEGYIDSSYTLTKSSFYSYSYPSFRSSFVANHKFNASHSVRAGVNYSFLYAGMSNNRLTDNGSYDTLVAPHGKASLFQSHLQWKFRTAFGLEINTGMHILHFSQNHQTSFEPRIGMRLNVMRGFSLLAGLGVHSRTESLAAYNTLIKTNDGERLPLNSDIGLAKAFHAIAGLDMIVLKNIKIRTEFYLQDLYEIPIVNRTTSRYSSINTSEKLPDSELENAGTGRNTGMEITIEKSFSGNYYFLVTGSLFDSWYTAGDGNRYNTVYNTKYAGNILAGRDFIFGREKRNVISINSKVLFRGGYRYTPVNDLQSIKKKRIIYLNTLTNHEQLPGFLRLDAGISFRRNFSRGSWIIMLDVQNATDRRNVFRRRFYIENKKIISTDVVSIGMVPILNFRIEF